MTIGTTKNEPESNCPSHQIPSLQEMYAALSIPKSNLNQIFPSQENSEPEFLTVLKKQAEEGSADAQFQLGECYHDGIGVKKSYKLAYQYYKLAAEQRYRSAQVSLARLYEYRYGVKQSYEKAYNKLAAKQGSDSALTQLDTFYVEGKNYQHKREVFEYAK